MNTIPKLSLFLLRISLGVVFLYAGLTKIMDSTWSAAGYIGAAKNLPSLYNFFLQPQVLPLVNIANEYGLALIGLSLILGIWVRLSSLAGIILMLLYYFAVLDFPHPNPNAYIVDEHIIYIMCLLVLSSFGAGKILGLGNKLG